MGYIGPSLTNQLRQSYPDATLIGYDLGYFAHCLTNVPFLPETKIDQQVFGDVRNFPEALLKGIDKIVYLAAISNDPMGNKFEEITLDVNYRAAVDLAKKAKKAGVKSFVFASSCSIYGEADDFPKTENSELMPLTAYARSKVYTEKELSPLGDSNFIVTCLRFATACGFSDRFRLDLVLNDFVASSLVNKEITILSNGTPWRPMINTKDMARAIDWAISRPSDNGGEFLVVNAGSNDWNVQVKPLAEAVASIIPGVKVTVNQDAPPDRRSYKVNFDLFKKLAPNHQPIHNLEATIKEIKENLEGMGFADKNFRSSNFIRLVVLSNLQKSGFLNENLEWK